VKQNYCAQPATMKFSMIPGGGIDWDPNPATDVTADNLLAVTGAPEEKAQRRNARAFLLTLLASGGGAVKTSEIVRAKEAAMISDRALQQAKYDLKIEAVHVGSPTGTGIGGYWMWKLP
jgi:hypothetical protein